MCPRSIISIWQYHTLCSRKCAGNFDTSSIHSHWEPLHCQLSNLTTHTYSSNRPRKCEHTAWDHWVCWLRVCYATRVKLPRAMSDWLSAWPSVCHSDAKSVFRFAVQPSCCALSLQGTLLAFLSYLFLFSEATSKRRKSLTECSVWLATSTSAWRRDILLSLFALSTIDDTSFRMAHDSCLQPMLRVACKIKGWQCLDVEKRI